MIKLKESNGELIYFRLAVLVSVISFFGFLTCSIYSQNKSNRLVDVYQEVVKTHKENRTKGEIDPSIEKIFEESYYEGLSSIRKDIADLRISSDRYLALSFTIPIVTLFLFYGGRWVILGKLRPLIPKHTERIDPR